MAEPDASYSTTREGLILNIFNRISVQEGVAHMDSNGRASRFKEDRDKVLDLLAAVIRTVDGKSHRNDIPRQTQVSPGRI